MEYIKGRTIVLGPGGPLRNPNFKQQEKVTQPQQEGLVIGDGFFDDFAAPKKPKFPTKQENKNPWKDGEFFMDFDMAVELAKTKSEQNPGALYHILRTSTVYSAQVAPAETLHFQNE